MLISVQQGRSLVELLIASVIFSTTLLGVGSLGLISLRATQEAFFHTQAMIKAESLGELLYLKHTNNLQPYPTDLGAQQADLGLPPMQIHFQSTPLHTEIEIRWHNLLKETSRLQLQVGEDGLQFLP